MRDDGGVQRRTPITYHATLRFYAELRDFLPRDLGSGTVERTFDVPGSVKDLIEACGVPHTEVDLIVANGRSVDFVHRVGDGDLISVYPVFETFDITPIVKVRPEPLHDTRFVADGHLGRLARRLRLLGFDTHYNRDAGDYELVAISTTEQRILLTRDIELLMHGAVTHAYAVRSTDPRTQMIEVVRRFHLGTDLAPFTRCMACNGRLTGVDKDDVADRLGDETRRRVDEFQTCRSCGRVYWHGAHDAELRRIVEAARRAEEPVEADR